MSKRTEYTGTFLSAVFTSSSGEDNIISNCTLDGKLLQLDIVFIPQFTSPKRVDRIICLPGNESTLGAGSHRFQAFSNGSPDLGFDGLFYVPMDFEAVKSVPDLVYPVRRNLTMAGDTFDFPFKGDQAALYTVYGDGGINQPVNLSYSLDGFPPINWTTDSTTLFPDTTITDYLLIQTNFEPDLSSHTLHVELRTDNVLVPLQYVIVQNSESNSGRNRVAFPINTSVPGSSASTTPTSAVPSQTSFSAGMNPTSSSAGPSQTIRAQHHRPGRDTVIYISVSVSVALILVFLGAVLVRRQRMKRARSHLFKAPNASGMILPFVERPSILRLTFDAVDSKNRRRMGIANGPERGRIGKRARNGEHPGPQMASVASVQSRVPRPPPTPPHPPQQMDQTTTPMAPVPAIAPTQPTYRFHEDAGSVRTTTPVPEEEVIDLPPNYSSILSRFRRASPAEGGESNGEGHGSGVTHESPEVDEEEIGMAY
ncbi:hypothetical protein D9613_012922 [Agrocybe pediades]|uniref:Uncharacterized protein n=1 Tax=Agrocybe pediades TaxID=84607 RepID=A0A8H4VIT4_9AGAR|nr:hypothetical protein D9613_012922 [Agrocybe pediades]